jgi:DNA-binding FadR family transcriptional regulator
VLRDHRTIFEALEARDPRAARSSIRRHLERVNREFIQGWKALDKAESTEPAIRAATPKPIKRVGRLARAG